MDAFIRDNLFNFWLLAQTCTVVVGRTRSVGPAPGGWSSDDIALQSLQVVVEETIHGDPPDTEVLDMAVPVVEGSRIVATEPGLASWVTTPGARLILFVEDGRPCDEDLGILPMSQDVREFLAQTLPGPPPPGVPSVLHLLSMAAEEDPAVPAALQPLDPGVYEFRNARGRTSRLTVVNGVLRVFSGLRRDRVADTRSADRVVEIHGADLALLLTGEWPDDLSARETDRPVLEALHEAGQAIARDPKRTRRIRAAGGLESTPP